MLLFSLAVAWPAQSETIVLSPEQDATLIESSAGSLANGSGPALFAGRTGQSSASARRALLQFDVAGALPGGARILDAWLDLSLSPSNPQLISFGLHRVSSTWGEGAAASSGGGGEAELEEMIAVVAEGDRAGGGADGQRPWSHVGTSHIDLGVAVNW